MTGYVIVESAHALIEFSTDVHEIQRKKRKERKRERSTSVKQDAVISSNSLCLLGMLTQKRAYLLTHSSIGELSFILNPGSLLILATKVLIL